MVRGGRWNDHRTTLDAMLWVLRCGPPWRDMPDRYGRWQSVYSRFRRWSRDGTLGIESFARCAPALPSQDANPADGEIKILGIDRQRCVGRVGGLRQRFTICDN